jgi:hypothetical protein
LDQLEKIAIDLTAAGRAQIAKKNFALTNKQSTTGKPAYPIHDAAHARAALRLVGMHGSEQQKAEVRKDVARKYPGMVREKVAGIVGNIRQAAKEGLTLEPNQLLKQAFLDELEKIGVNGKMKLFLEGMKHEAGPALGATLGAGAAKMYGIDPLAGAAAGYGVGALPDIVRGVRGRVRTPQTA